MEKDTREKYYVACPICGRVVMKGKYILKGEMTCPKCSTPIEIDVIGKTVSVKIVSNL